MHTSQLSAFSWRGLSSQTRAAILALLGLFLLYAILTKSLSAYLADDAPQTALSFNPRNSAALLNLAEGKLAADDSFKLLDPVLTAPRNVGPGSSFAKGDVTAEPLAPNSAPAIPDAQPAEAPKQSTLDPAALAQIQALAEDAVLEDPLNARALRILGQISEITSDEEHTENLMRAAVRRSQLESVAVYWMMRKSFQDQNYNAALRYADTLLRTRPQALGPIMPMMGKMAELPEASADLKLLLSTNPPWRPQFLSFLPNAISDARTPLDILLSLKDTANPPKATDLRPYLDFLIQHGFYDLAYYTWLQFLAPEQLAQAGHLYNGGFDAPPSGTPFDWMLTKGTGVTVQVAAKGEKPGERALLLKFGPGRVDYHDVTQLIMLSPDTYDFRGQYKGDLVSERGLEWRVVCAGKDQNIIGRGVVARGGSSTQWKDLDFSFTVPAADCPAQYVKLVFDARSASERFISGNIWFDDFKIAREEPTVATQPTVMPGAPPESPQPAEASGSTAAPGPITSEPTATAEPNVLPPTPLGTSQPPAEAPGTTATPAAPPEPSGAPAATAEPNVAPPPETVQPTAPSATTAAPVPAPERFEAPAGTTEPSVAPAAPPETAQPALPSGTTAAPVPPPETSEAPPAPAAPDVTPAAPPEAAQPPSSPQ